MKFTFGIITSGTPNLPTIYNSIMCQDIPDVDIIVVGGEPSKLPIRHIPFDETIKNAWITKKKNLIVENAKHENIVFMHDYFCLDQAWYQGFQLFGNNWDVCMNMIINTNGFRFRDWCIYHDPNHCFTPNGHRAFLVPYSYDKKEYMYVSGGYWVAKKSIMLKYPLDESKVWGEGEDVEWSERVLKNCSYKMNPLSIVRMLKYKPVELGYLDI